MSSISKWSFYTSFVVIFCFDQAYATKCFVKTDLVGIKEIFPIVIRGKVVERTSLKNKKGSFILRIQTLESVKGNFIEKYTTAEEVHLDTAGLSKHTYLVGDEFYFPISQKPGKKENSVYLPADGCPALPK